MQSEPVLSKNSSRDPVIKLEQAPKTLAAADRPFLGPDAIFGSREGSGIAEALMGPLVLVVGDVVNAGGPVPGLLPHKTHPHTVPSTTSLTRNDPHGGDPSRSSGLIRSTPTAIPPRPVLVLVKRKAAGVRRAPSFDEAGEPASSRMFGDHRKRARFLLNAW